MSERKDNKKRNSIIRIIVLIVLLIALIILVFFLIGRFVKPNNNSQDDEVSENYEESYNRLLKVLNDNINKTKVDGEQEASKLLSFSYNENHFYISGYNDEIVYYYDVDLSSKSLASSKEAYDYVIKNDIEGLFEITLDRYSPTSSTEFTSKYSMDGLYKIGQLGSSTKVFATLYNNSSIVVMNGVELTTALDNNYGATAMIETHPLYQIYKYIATK